MKSHVDFVYQHCKGKGAGRADGVSMTFDKDCSYQSTNNKAWEGSVVHLQRASMQATLVSTV